MKKLLAFAFLMTGLSVQAETYFCNAPLWNAETKFEGQVGIKGAMGALLYFGPNPGDAKTDGTYEFLSPTRFTMYFEGEPLHICDQWKPKLWYCKMNKWFRYKLYCDF